MTARTPVEAAKPRMSSIITALPRSDAAAPAPASSASSAIPTPGLIVLFGASTNKKLLLNRPAIMVGSGLVCDIKLKTPDIGEVHALIIQTPEGLLLRDCKTATGTLVNGSKIEEIYLKNDDILQFGAFQFKARVPEGWPPKPGADTPAAPLPAANNNHHGSEPLSTETVETLEQKRRRLTQMAWARRNLTQYQAKQLENAQIRIGQLESELKQLKGQLEKANEQAQAAQGLTQQQSEAAQQRQALEARIQEAEEKLALQQAEANQQRQALEERARQAEENLKALAKGEEELARLQAKQAEAERLQEAAQHRHSELETLRQTLQERQAQLDQQQQAMQEMQEELDRQQGELDQQRRQAETQQAEGAKKLLQLGEEETLFRAEVASLKAELERLGKEKAEFEQHHRLMQQEAEQVRQGLELVRQQEKQLQEQCAKLREEQALASKPLEERRAFLQQLEETLAKQREEFDQQQQGWTTQRQQQEGHLQTLRAELAAKETEVSSTLGHLEEQKKAHSRRQHEHDRMAADLKEKHEDLDRQRVAIQRETEMWFDQRNTLGTEVTARQQEIEQLVGRCKELRFEESKLEASIAEWNAHLEKEMRSLEEQRAKIKADADAEARRSLEKERKSLEGLRERVESQVAKLYAQTEIHLEQCLNLLQTERERFGELRQEYSPPQS